MSGFTPSISRKRTIGSARAVTIEWSPVRNSGMRFPRMRFFGANAPMSSFRKARFYNNLRRSLVSLSVEPNTNYASEAAFSNSPI